MSSTRAFVSLAATGRVQARSPPPSAAATSAEAVRHRIPRPTPLDLVDPGLVQLLLWKPGGKPSANLARISAYAAVARKS